MATGPDLLDEYAAALRNSWGAIDGRAEQSALNTLSTAMRLHGSGELPTALTEGLRVILDVCQRGSGHWTDECERECEAL